MSKMPDESNPIYKLVARTNNVLTILKVLQVVNFREYATFIIRDTSITVTVEEMKCIQSNAYINADCFHEYNVDKDTESAAFKVNLSHVVTCLKVHSKSSAYLKLSYRGHGFPLELLVEENGVITDCQLKTFPPEEVVQFNMDRVCLNRVTMTCEILKAIVRELDPTSETIEIALSPITPNLSFVTNGSGGEGKIEIDHFEDTLRTFEVAFNYKSTFKFSHLKMAFKPLTAFNLVCMKLDDGGLLRLQYQTGTQNMRHVLAEFYVMPLIENDDD